MFLGVALLVLWWTRTGPRSGHDRRFRQAAALALSFTGAAGYLIWLWAKTGDISAWTHSQRDVFDRHQEWPWSTLHEFLALLVRDHRSAFVLQHTLEFVAAALMLWALVALVRRAEWAAAVFVALTLASLMTSTSYLSLARNSITLFPLAVLVADVAVHSRRRALVRAGAGGVRAAHGRQRGAAGPRAVGRLTPAAVRCRPRSAAPPGRPGARPPSSPSAPSGP